MTKRSSTCHILTLLFLGLIQVSSLDAQTPPTDKPQAEAKGSNAEKPVTLMGLLQPWFYPDAKFGGAESSDAGVSNISSIKSKAVLTTGDSVDDVLDFYCQRLQVDRTGKNVHEKEGERITTEQSVSIQDLSAGRPCEMFVICVRKEKSSTTVVVSRVEGEDKTTIGWSNFRHLWP